MNGLNGMNGWDTRLVANPKIGFFALLLFQFIYCILILSIIEGLDKVFLRSKFALTPV